MGVFLILAVRAALILETVVSVSMMVITGISRAQPLVDPFAPYTDVMPGQSRESLIGHGFECRFNGAPFYDEFCSLEPEIGIFSEIRVTFAPALSTNIIGQTRFILRENELSIGTVVLLWGTPKMSFYGRTANPRWNDRRITAISYPYYKRAIYQLPIRQVVFGVIY